MRSLLLPDHPREWTGRTWFTAVGGAAIYFASVVGANILAERFGLIPLLPGLDLLVVAGTYAVGVTLLARNICQDITGRLPILAIMIAGAAVSWWLASPALAVASGVTFLLSESADMLVYSPLRSRGWSRAVLCAVVVSALVDSVVFLWLAGFPLTVESAGGQWLGKVLVTAVAVALTNAVPPLRRLAARPLPA